MPTSSPLLRRAFLAVAIAALAVGSAACQPPPASAPKAASYSGSGETSELVSLVNAFRSGSGVSGLAVAGDAAAKAQQHANDMAAAGAISHSGNLASGIQSGWRGIAENVGTGSSVSAVQAALEASAPHRANLLNGSYTQIGVGVAHSADGRVYVTEIFVAR